MRLSPGADHICR